MAIKNAQYNVKNQNGFDTYHFETSEDMIVGQIQQMGHTGYRVLAGGLILIWGTVAIKNSSHEVEINVTFPVTVASAGFPVFGCYDANGQVFVNATNRTTTGFKMNVKSLMSATGSSIGIGAVRVNYQIVCEV